MLPALLALVALAGCTIVDQRTFARWAPAGPVEPARAGLPALPVITIRFDQALDQKAIAEAVELAMARKPSTVFDVVAPVPAGESAAAQAEAVRQGREDTERVATAIAAAGAARDHIELGLRADPGTPQREVRVYAR